MIAFAPSNHQRERLRAGWQACSAPSGAAFSPSSGTSQAAGERPGPAPSDAVWVTPGEGVAGAAALRQNGAWSLDGPAVRFDAQDWWYSLTFDAPQLLPGQRAVLGFDGLATVATVWLNGLYLLSSSNMFVGHECDVSHSLRSKDNELTIHFSGLDASLAVRRKRPRWRAPMLAHQQLRWFRTTLLGRTPGWSPPAAVVGPWKDVWLEHRDSVDIRDLRIDARVEGTDGAIRCRFELGPVGAATGQAIESVWLEVARQGQVFTQVLAPAGSGGIHEGELRLPQVTLWWPHTHGDPALYEIALRVQLSGATGPRTFAAGRVGFRTIRLDTDDDGFSLSINGVAVFCRGACWTPLDPVTLRSSPGACAAAVAQACEAGMNMLRVSGTMVYEEDHFYQACDEQGMLVWQDFMFANMDYPVEDEAFAASVLLEVRQQLSRLQASACLAVLCGNSEVEQQAAMWGAPADAWQPALFTGAIAQLCAELAPGTPYWPSSAHGGAFPHQANAGTTSYYGVGAYLRPLEDARRANLKFATECLAFANVPGAAALERMPGGLATRAHHPAWKERSPRDLGAGWDFDDVRDHYLGLVFNTNPQQLRHTDHEHYLTLSRMATGEVMAASFSEWRRPGSSCSGALVLFLRDLWAGAGWGVVDDRGMPKACYHYLKRVLQPVTVLLSDEGLSGLFIHVLNERAEDRLLEVELSAWHGGDVLVASGKQRLSVAGRSATSLSALELLGHFADLTYAFRFGPMSSDAVSVTLSDERGEKLANAFYFPAGLFAAREASVGLSATAVMTGPGTAELTVRTSRFAHGIYFDIPGFEADDEYFHLTPGTTVRVTLRGGVTQPPAGAVHAGNSMESARIDWTVDDPAGQGKGEARDR